MLTIAVADKIADTSLNFFIISIPLALITRGK